MRGTGLRRQVENLYPMITAARKRSGQSVFVLSRMLVKSGQSILFFRGGFDCVVPGIVIFFGNFSIAEGIPRQISADSPLKDRADDRALLVLGEGIARVVILNIESTDDPKDLIDLCVYDHRGVVEQERVLDILGGHGDAVAAGAEKLDDRHPLPALGDRIDGRNSAHVLVLVAVHPVQNGEGAVSTRVPQVQESVFLR